MNQFFSWQHAILKSQLEPTTKHVCLTIGCHMAADGSGCFPSYGTISEESGLGRSTVIMHVQKAAKAGYLGIDARTRANGSTTSNVYRPTMPGGVQQVDPGSPASGRGVVQQVDPHNNPSEQPNEHSPHPPQGESERDVFLEIVKAYPVTGARLDVDAARHVWTRNKLSTEGEAILAGLSRLQASADWNKEQRRFVPKLSNFLQAGAWRPTVPAARKDAPLMRNGEIVGWDQLTNTERLAAMDAERQKMLAGARSRPKSAEGDAE